MNWSLFDGQLTKGRVQEARARHERVQIDYEDARRRIELEVRALYSTFVEAREVLDSQQKVIEQATEALRLATARYEAGADTQLNVLSSQTALTDARTVYVQALHAYSVALARLQRAMGMLVTQRDSLKR
jgi:outer membrane protein TolC